MEGVKANRLLVPLDDINKPSIPMKDLAGGIFKKCVNSQAVYPLSEQHGLEAQKRR